MAIWESAHGRTADCYGQREWKFYGYRLSQVGTGTLAAYSGQTFWVIAAGGVER